MRSRRTKTGTIFNNDNTNEEKVIDMAEDYFILVWENARGQSKVSETLHCYGSNVVHEIKRILTKNKKVNFSVYKAELILEDITIINNIGD